MISVIVCTYNREKYLPDCLGHLKNQSADASEYEVVIINNNSPDRTEEISKEFIATSSELNIQYHVEMNQGHTYARNRGIAESKGDILAFIDDDAFVAQDYITNMTAYFRGNTNTLAIGGKIIPKYEGQPPKWMSKHLFPLVSALDMGNSSKPFKYAKFPIGANMAYRKSAFDKYGFFDVDLGRRGDGLEGGDEKEMISRLRADSAPIDYVPNVVVDHIIPDKRLQMDYIKGLAKGVAKSERKRLTGKTMSDKLSKIVSELVKISGTVVLSIMHAIMLQFPKSVMLIKFRYWVVTGYLENE